MNVDVFRAAIRATTYLTVVAALSSTGAWAQEAATQADRPVPDIINPNAKAEQAKGGEIIITGSRIKRDEFSSPSPIQVIDPEISRLAGTIDTAEMIQSSSVAAGSAQVTAAISSNFVTNGGPGASTISLRGLGAERTLVLLNGRRAGPAGVRGAVSAFDLNVMPTSIVQSVEILKDGASSIYGSDAVAGVVNLITRKKTDGLELDGFVSTPFKSGGEQYRLSATWGKEFDRGHFIATVDYYKRKELARGQRKYLSCPEDYIFREDGSRADPIDPRTGKPACREAGGLWGHVWLYDYSYIYSQNPSQTVDPVNGRPIRLLQHTYNDNLGKWLPGFPSPQDPYQLGAPEGFYLVNYTQPNSVGLTNYYHPAINEQTVIPSTKRYTAYVEGEYELNDHLTLYGEGLFNRRETYQNGWRQFWQFGFTSSSTLPGLFGMSSNPIDGDAAAQGFTGDYLISPTIITNIGDSGQRVDYYRSVLGLKGDLDGGFLSGWSWDVFSQYSRSSGKYMNDQIYDDAIGTQDFRVGSCAGQVTEFSGNDCLDINWTDPRFLKGDLTAAQRNYLFGREYGHTRYTQWNFEASASGDLFKLPGGNAQLALGATLRRDAIDDTPGSITYIVTGNGPEDFTNNAWGTSASGRTKGHSITKELFGELSLPVLGDMPLIKDFTLSGAARVTNVKSVRSSDGFSDSDNGNWTYKLGANWEVSDWLRFRGTYGTSYRAPALFEQFLADQTSFIDNKAIDPCIAWGANLADGVIPQRVADNCAADGIPDNYLGGGVEATVVTGGGIGVLKPETSTAKTFSVVLSPRFDFMPRTRVSLAVDYFDIRVKGEIGQLGAGQVLYGCYNSDYYPTDPLCSLFTRGQPAAPYNIDRVRDSFINVNRQRNEGIDFTLRLDQDLGRWGKLNMVAQATYQMKDTVALFEGTVENNNGEAGEPKWVGDLDLTWQKGGTSLYYGVTYVGSTSDERDYIDTNGDLCRTSTVYGRYCVQLKAKSRIYHSISLSQEIMGGRFEITGGISNLFDKKPPRTTTKVLNGNEIETLGQSVFASQYDMIGRRGFLGIKAKF